MQATLTSKRRALRIGTALATGIIGIMQITPAQAQNIPDSTLPTISNANGAQVTTNNGAGTVTVNMTSSGGTTASRNLVWSNLQLGANGTLNYTTDVAGAAIPIVALNTVTNGAAISVIEGSINAQSNIAVWLINPQGMLFSNGSSFNGASLVLSTLTPREIGGNPADDDLAHILSGVGVVELGLTNGDSTDLTGKITISPTAALTSSGQVALISQQIEMNGSIDATGDVGLVLGQGITMASATASPLAYTIQGGTKLAAAQLLAGGDINGANVRLYAVSEDAVTGALLQVDSTSAITATAANGAVILSAERDDGPNDVASLSSAGSLTANGATGSITISSDGAATVSGALSANGLGGSVTVGGGGVTTITGAVDAGLGGYTVTGQSIVLGDSAVSATAVTQSTTGAISLTSNSSSPNDGDLTVHANVSLASDGDTTIDADDIARLNGAMAIGGAYTVTADSALIGNATAKTQQAAGNISITTDTADLTVATNMDLISSGGTIGLTTTSGDIIVRGLVQASGDLTLTSSSSVKFAAYDAVNANSVLRSINGNIVVDAGESVIGEAGTVGAVPTALRGTFGYDVTGDLTVNVAGDLTVNRLNAGGNLSLTVGGALAGAPGGTLPVLGSGSLYAPSGSITVKANANGSSVVLDEVQALTGTTIWGDEIAIGTMKQGSGTLTFADHDNSNDLLAASAPFDYYIGLLTKTGNLTVTAGHSGVAATVVSTAVADAFDSGFGKANLSAGGSISGTITDGAQLGTVNAGTTINLTAGGLLATSSTAGSSTTFTATAGTLALGTITSPGVLTLDKQGGAIATAGDELRLGTATVNAGGATLTSSTHIRLDDLAVTSGAISLTATNGDISGLLTGTGGSLALVSTANQLDADYGAADLTASGSSVTVSAANGGAQLGTVSANTFVNVSAKAASVTSYGAGTTANLSATQGTLVVVAGTAGGASTLTKAGGSAATAGDELRVVDTVFSGLSGAGPNTSLTSSTHVDVGRVWDFSNGIDIDANGGDAIVRNQVVGRGNIDIAASRDVLIANYNSGSGVGLVSSQVGSVTINAGRSVYGIGGSDSALPVVPGSADGILVIGNLTVQGVGDIFKSTLSATGSITFNLTGSVYGSNGTPGADVPGGAIQAVTGITVNANGAGGVNVLKSASVTGGNLTLKGESIAIGTPLASGTISYLDLSNNPISAANLYVGLTTINGDYILNASDPITYTNLVATENLSAGPVYGPEKFEASVGKTNVSAGSSISGTITGAAQFADVTSGDAMSLTVGGLVADSITVNVDSLDITATTGTLSILDALVSGTMTLTKQGGSVATAGDDLRVLTASTGGSINLTSNTSIRAGSLNAGGAAISLTATNGDISGMRLGTAGAMSQVSTTSVLDADYDRLNLASAGTLTVAAANGAVQLGTAQAAGDVTVDAAALGATQLQSTGGFVDAATTSGSLNVDTASAATTLTLNKTGTNGELRFTSISGVGIDIDSVTDVIGTAANSSTGLADIRADRDITLDTVIGSSASVIAQRDAAIGTAATTNNVVVGGARDLVVDQVTSTAGVAQAIAGRDVTVNVSVSGQTGAQGRAGILDPSGNLAAPLITSATGSAVAIAAADANVGTLSGVGATVSTGGDYTGNVVSAGSGAANLTIGGNGDVGAISGNGVTMNVTGTFDGNTINSGAAVNATVGSAMSVSTINAATGITVNAGAIHAQQMQATSGNIGLTAATGDITGALTGTPGAVPLVSAGRPLSANYGELNLLTPGNVTVSAANGGVQLGIVSNGGLLDVDAAAITLANFQTAGEVTLSATQGTLDVGTGVGGLSIILDKAGGLDELRFGTLSSGLIAGGTTGATTVTSSTSIRGSSIVANGGPVSVSAANGEVTGLSGGRLALTAAPDLDGVGQPIPLTDSTVDVVSGRLARLGNVVAGSGISITAGVSGSPTLGGAIDMLDGTTANNGIALQSYNQGQVPAGVSFEDLSAPGSITYLADGTSSGNVVGQSVTSATSFGFSQAGNVTLGTLTGTTFADLTTNVGDITVTTMNVGASGTFISAGDDIQIGDLTSTGFAQLTAGGDVTVTGILDTGTFTTVTAANLVDIATAVADTTLTVTATSGSLALQSGTAANAVALTSGTGMELGTITSNTSTVTLTAGGDITGANGFTNNAAQRPDLQAATGISVTAAGAVELDQANTSAGNLAVTAGSLTSDGAIDINNAQAGAGSIQLAATATGTPADGDHDGTVRVGTANAGTTLTLSNVLFGGTIGDVVVGTSATVGTDAFFDAADNARIESANATGTIAVRAGDAISGGVLNTPAALTAGEDLALKSGTDVDLGSASAGDDLIIESNTSIAVGALSAAGTGSDTRSVSFASGTQIAIVGSEPNPGASIVVRSSGGSVDASGLLSATGSVTIDAADDATVTGAVQAGINYTVLAVNDITLGGNAPVTQSANGAVAITSTSGQVTDGSGALTLRANADGVGAETISITAPGGIQINQATLVGGNGGKQSDVLLTSTSGAISLAGIDAARLIAVAGTGFTSAAPISVGSAATGADPAAGPSTVDIRVTGGNIQLDDVTAAGAGHDIRLAASGTITTGVLDAARSIIANGLTSGTASGAFSADSLVSAGPVDIRATSIDVTGASNLASTLTLNATAGNIDLGATSANGAMSLTASGSLGATSLTTAGGGGITGTGSSVGVTGAISSSGPLTLSATGGAMTLNTASSNGAMSLTSTGALTAATLTSTGGGITGSGGSVSITGAANAGGPLSLTATAGDVNLASGTASGQVDLKASAKVTTGTLNAGANAVNITGADADITGTVTGSVITLANSGGASNALRIGAGAEGSGGFQLDEAEINRLAPSDKAILDAGTGTGLTATDVKIGDLTLTSAALQTLWVYGKQRIDLNGGLIKGAGSGLTALRLGGSAADADLASVIRIAATADGTGALIDLGSALLELRGAKIGMGQDAGFLDQLGIGATPSGTPLDPRQVVSNPASGLYSATNQGGTAYQTAAQVVIRANTMIVRYSDFALFQNTGEPSVNEGVRLASSAGPQAPALQIIGPASPLGGPFGLFGEVNGIRDTATALLGDSIIRVQSVDRTSARINGCLIGSGAGCLTTLALTPILGTFDPVRGSIFFANADFELPFDPLVGTNNDSLFGDVGTFGLEDVPLESIDCTDEQNGAQCGKPNGDDK